MLISAAKKNDSLWSLVDKEIDRWRSGFGCLTLELVSQHVGKDGCYIFTDAEVLEMNGLRKFVQETLREDTRD